MKKNNFYFFVANRKDEKLIDSFYSSKKKPLSAQERKKIRNFMKDVKNKNFDKIIRKIENFEEWIQFSTFTSFCVYKDTSLSTLRSALNDTENEKRRKSAIKAIKKLVNDFLERRKVGDYLQAISDSRSSKDKGSMGQEKLTKIAKKYGAKEYRIKDFQLSKFKRYNKCIIKITNKNDFKRTKGEIGFVYTGNKIPDLLLKIKEHIFVIEAKHVHECGGAQSGQISELIEHIKNRNNKNSKIHYVGFLDGQYANLLKYIDLKRKDKLSSQRKEIETILKKRKHNFFVNTDGFIELIKNYFKT